jgi:DNA-dependent RNA polymerase auxiliary subunit epsilon
VKRELILKWIDKTLERDLHEKIYIPAETKPDAQQTVRDFKKELIILYDLEPEQAGTIVIAYTFRDRRHWVVLERTLGNPLVGFVKKKDGTLARVEIEIDSERDRRLQLMKEDGLTLEEVEEIEGELTDIEKEIF